MATAMSDSILVRAMTAEDWPAVRRIYMEGIATGNATFERAAPDWDNWDGGHLPNCRLVAEIAAAVEGWSALSRVSQRCSTAVSRRSASTSRNARAGAASAPCCSRDWSRLLKKLVSGRFRPVFSRRTRPALRFIRKPASGWWERAKSWAG